MDNFDKDLDFVFQRLLYDLNEKDVSKLREIRAKLSFLHRQQLVKSNHSIMELVIAKYFISKGYDVDIERKVSKNLVCDLYCKSDGETIIVEVETGFVPPENARDPVTYRFVRIVSKIARYSLFANRFFLATPVYHILQIPRFFLIPPNEREEYFEEAIYLKKVCDKYYKRPPITLKELMGGKLDGILVVNVDEGIVFPMIAKDYYGLFIDKLIKMSLVKY